MSLSRLRVAFHLLHFTERGTSAAVYDYAEGNEEILGNASLIIHPACHSASHPQVELRFRRRFLCRAYNRPEEIERILLEERADCIYTLASGEADIFSAPSRRIPNLVHAVFHPRPHGDRYAVISPCLSLGGEIPVVPHIVRELPAEPGGEEGTPLRTVLGIPPEDIVLGRHGGRETFNAPGAETAMLRHLEKEDLRGGRKTWFLLLNTAPLAGRHPRILYGEATGDKNYIASFISACDAMLHARQDGETFGLSVAEFALRGKPVLTYPSPEGANNHLEVLGEKALLWHDAGELEKLLEDLPSLLAEEGERWRSFTQFSQREVMEKFREVFLSGITASRFEAASG